MATATLSTAKQGAPKPPTAATPWGTAALLEEAAVPQRVGDKRFTVIVQLLEAPNGERLIRFAYTTDGSARRGPVTMRARDLERLRAALERAPVLAQALQSAIADSKAREDPSSARRLRCKLRRDESVLGGGVDESGE